MFRNLIVTSKITPKLIVRDCGPLTTRQLTGCVKTRMATYATVSYVTAPNEEAARNLARELVKQRLAACVNIVKTIESVYEWKDQIEQDSEALLIIKSHSSKTIDLAEFVEKNHPYDCPEVVTVKIDGGSNKYLEWINESIQKPPITSRTQTEDKSTK